MQQARPATTSSDLQRRRRHAQRIRHVASAHRHHAVVDMGAPAQAQRQRQHGQHAEDADADIGLAPAPGVDRVLQDRRPDRAGDIAAAGDDRDRDAAALLEPVRDLGDQRPEGGGRAEHADHERLRRHERPEPGRLRRDDVAHAQHERADHHRQHDAEAVGQPAHQHAAEREAEHGRGIGQRGVAAIDAELGLDHRQDDDRRPHADAADRAERHRGGEPPPGIAAVGQILAADRDLRRRHARPLSGSRRAPGASAPRRRPRDGPAAR